MAKWAKWKWAAMAAKTAAKTVAKTVAKWAASLLLSVFSFSFSFLFLFLFSFFLPAAIATGQVILLVVVGRDFLFAPLFVAQSGTNNLCRSPNSKNPDLKKQREKNEERLQLEVPLYD